MKWILTVAAAAWLGGMACAQAQMDATAAAAGAAPIQVTDTEATIIAQAIKGYMQGAKFRGNLEIFDRKKGELIILRLDRLVTDDPERVAFPQEGQIAVCGECTQMVKGKDGQPDEEGSDKYEVWFVVHRGGTVSSRVLDTYIKSVNGVPMYTWTKDETGKWSATLATSAE